MTVCWDVRTGWDVLTICDGCGLGTCSHACLSLEAKLRQAELGSELAYWAVGIIS